MARVHFMLMAMILGDLASFKGVRMQRLAITIRLQRKMMALALTRMNAEFAAVTASRKALATAMETR